MVRSGHREAAIGASMVTSISDRLATELQSQIRMLAKSPMATGLLASSGWFLSAAEI